METIIANDINNLLYSISIKYNIDLDILQKRYIPKITIEKKKEKKPRKIIKPYKASYIDPTVQCTARVWGGSNPVSYNKDTNTWCYGSRCTKTKYGPFSHCTTHHKLIKKYGNLPHGEYNEDPPHHHYDKFKRKILESN